MPEAGDRSDVLRAIVQDVVARHLRGGTPPPAPARAHASHVILHVLSGEAVGDGACVIEPAVPCTHCGYCQSYGH